MTDRAKRNSGMMQAISLMTSLLSTTKPVADALADNFSWQ